MISIVKLAIAVKSSKILAFESFCACGQNVSRSANKKITDENNDCLYVWDKEDFYLNLNWSWFDLIDFLRGNEDDMFIFITRHDDRDRFEPLAETRGNWKDNPWN